VRQLIWKEWHEQSWKLAFGCIVLAAFAAIGLRTRIIPDEEMVMWVCFPALGLLPLLAATGLIPAERNDGTLESLAALPVTWRQILAVKTLTGVILCAVPLLVAMAVSLMIAGGREIPAFAMFNIYMQSLLTAIALFAWILAMTVRLPTEARAAMVGIGVSLCWIMLSGGMFENDLVLLSTISPFSFVFYAEYHAGPRTQQVPPFAINVLVEAVIAAALWMWTSRAIGKDVNAVG
jgi:ABC-type transport system involved in multi-copper enzyme maturation permease subunit